MSGLAASSTPECRFGIVTALPKEFAAVRAMLDCLQDLQIPGDPNDYAHGIVPAADGSGTHHVVATLLKKPGNNSAAAAASHLLRSFPQVDDVLMVGIAGGAPHPADADKHVRLGDIVVSNEYGVFQWDAVKRAPRRVEHRDTSSAPSPFLLGRANLLETKRIEGHRPWEEHIARAARLEGSQRPDDATDRLFDAANQKLELPHPPDPSRRPGQPRVHRGCIGSANTLLKDPKQRDRLRDEFGVRAIEMEGSGIADASWTARQGYLLVRGVSDYCDTHKNDLWQGYAAVVAAAYARALIASATCHSDPKKKYSEREAKAALEHSWDLLEHGDSGGAVTAAEEAYGRAVAAGETLFAQRALTATLRALAHHMHVSRCTASEKADSLRKLEAFLKELEALGATPVRLALEQALVARAKGDGPNALQWALKAFSSSEAGSLDRADALTARLQALWLVDREIEALPLRAELDSLRAGVEHADSLLVLEATWLRSIVRADRFSQSDLDDFLRRVRNLSEGGTLTAHRVIARISEVIGELMRHDLTGPSSTLSEMAYDMASAASDHASALEVALRTAELFALNNDVQQSRFYLGRAMSHSESARAALSTESVATLRAGTLYMRGRTLARLAFRSPEQSDDGPEHLYEEAADVLGEASSIAKENRSSFGGDVDLFLAECAWWLGRISMARGATASAASLFREARTDAALAHEQFSENIAFPAWLAEAQATLLLGDIRGACRIERELQLRPNVPSAVLERARGLDRYITERLEPLLEWFASPEASGIASVARRTSLHEAVAEQMAPLVSWWEAWSSNETEPQSLLLDFWGRGGFSRLVAALRAVPHNAIAVDARTVDEIRRIARMLCPLFDTVVVKWKGNLGAGLVMVPMHKEYEAFGGHGYAVDASVEFRDMPDWTVAMGWANPVPRELSTFTSQEALELVRAGRLVVLPAPLVGCTQTAVGWTDDLLAYGLLGGIVSVAQHGAAPRPGGRVLDLTQTSIPYVDGVGLADLARVLDETAEWVNPLRRTLLTTLQGDKLRWEQWEHIANLEGDIRDACRLFRERLQRFAARSKEPSWLVREFGGFVTTAEPSRTAFQGHDPITDVLRSIVTPSEPAAPWVPFWRLEDIGGELNWSCPLNNRSTAAPTGAVRVSVDVPKDQIHSWLYSGTGGWTIPTAFAPPS